MENNNIFKVYSGRAGKCCCGCAGKYSYSSEHRDWGSKDRGYDVRDEEISDRRVRMIARKVLNDEGVEHEGDHSWVEIGNRLLIVYYKS